MPKTTWTLDLKSGSAVREARSLQRGLRSLQSALEDVDGAASRASRSLGGLHAPAGLAGVQRRARAERGLAQDVTRSTEAQRLGLARVSQDLRTQQKIRTAVDRAQRSNAARAASLDRQRQAASDRAWNADLRRTNRSARGEIARQRASDRAWQAELRHINRVAHAEMARERQTFRASRTGSSVTGVSRLGRLGGALGGLGTGLGMGLGAAGAAVGIASTIVGAATTFASMAASAVQMTVSLGESVLQMVAFREAALTTLRAMNGGSAAAASEQFTFARQFARETPLDAQQVLELQSQVSTAGFRGQQNREVLLGAADVGAANPNDATAASRYVRAVSQIRNAGRVRAQEMNQLGEVGIGRRDLLLALGRQANVRRGTNETEDAFLARLGQMQERGRFTGEQGVNAAQDVVRRQWSGGENGVLGSFARAQGDTLLGTLSNLRGAIFDLVTGLDQIEQAPGVRLLKQTLNGLAGTLSGAGSAGKQLQGVVRTLINDFSAIGATGVMEVTSGFADVLSGSKEALPTIRELAQVFSSNLFAETRAQLQVLRASLGDSFGNPEIATSVALLTRSVVSLGFASIRASIAIAEAAATLTIGTDQILRQISNPLLLQGTPLGGLTQPVSTMDRVRATFGDRDAQQRVAMGTIGERLGLQSGDTQPVGINAVNGIREGIALQRPALDSDLRSLGDSIPRTTNEALDSHSPSRVMRDEVGRWIPLGIAAGIEAGRGPLDAAMASLVGTPGAGDLGGMASLGGGGVSIGELHIHVGAGGDEDSGRTAARGFVDELVRLMETPALAG